MKKLKKNLQLQVIAPLVIAQVVLSAVAVYVEYYVESDKLRDEHLNTVRRTEWLMYEKIDENAVVHARLADEICRDDQMREAFLSGDRNLPSVR